MGEPSKLPENAHAKPSTGTAWLWSLVWSMCGLYKIPENRINRPVASSKEQLSKGNRQLSDDPTSGSRVWDPRRLALNPRGAVRHPFGPRLPGSCRLWAARRTAAAAWPGPAPGRPGHLAGAASVMLTMNTSHIDYYKS